MSCAPDPCRIPTSRSSLHNAAGPSSNEAGKPARPDAEHDVRGRQHDCRYPFFHYTRTKRSFGHGEWKLKLAMSVCKYDGSICPWGIRGSRSAYRDAMIGPVLGPFFLRTVDLRSSHCRSDESSSQYTSAMANTITGSYGKRKNKIN